MKPVHPIIFPLALGTIVLLDASREKGFLALGAVVLHSGMFCHYAPSSHSSCQARTAAWQACQGASFINTAALAEVIRTLFTRLKPPRRPTRFNIYSS